MKRKKTVILQFVRAKQGTCLADEYTQARKAEEKKNTEAWPCENH